MGEIVEPTFMTPLFEDVALSKEYRKTLPGEKLQKIGEIQIKKINKEKNPLLYKLSQILSKKLKEITEENERLTKEKLGLEREIITINAELEESIKKNKAQTLMDHNMREKLKQIETTKATKDITEKHGLIRLKKSKIDSLVTCINTVSICLEYIKDINLPGIVQFLDDSQNIMNLFQFTSTEYGFLSTERGKLVDLQDDKYEDNPRSNAGLFKYLNTYGVNFDREMFEGYNTIESERTNINSKESQDVELGKVKFFMNKARKLAGIPDGDVTSGTPVDREESEQAKAEVEKSMYAMDRILSDMLDPLHTLSIYYTDMISSFEQIRHGLICSPLVEGNIAFINSNPSTTTSELSTTTSELSTPTPEPSTATLGPVSELKNKPLIELRNLLMKLESSGISKGSVREIQKKNQAIQEIKKQIKTKEEEAIQTLLMGGAPQVSKDPELSKEFIELFESPIFKSKRSFDDAISGQTYNVDVDLFVDEFKGKINEDVDNFMEESNVTQIMHEVDKKRLFSPTSIDIPESIDTIKGFIDNLYILFIGNDEGVKNNKDEFTIIEGKMRKMWMDLDMTSNSFNIIFPIIMDNIFMKKLLMLQGLLYDINTIHLGQTKIEKATKNATVALHLRRKLEEVFPEDEQLKGQIIFDFLHDTRAKNILNFYYSEELLEYCYNVYVALIYFEEGLNMEGLDKYKLRNYLKQNDIFGGDYEYVPELKELFDLIDDPPPVVLSTHIISKPELEPEPEPEFELPSPTLSQPTPIDEKRKVEIIKEKIDDMKKKFNGARKLHSKMSRAKKSGTIYQLYIDFILSTNTFSQYADDYYDLLDTLLLLKEKYDKFNSLTVFATLVFESIVEVEDSGITTRTISEYRPLPPEEGVAAGVDLLYENKSNQPLYATLSVGNIPQLKECLTLESSRKIYYKCLENIEMRKKVSGSNHPNFFAHPEIEDDTIKKMLDSNLKVGMFDLLVSKKQKNMIINTSYYVLEPKGLIRVMFDTIEIILLDDDDDNDDDQNDTPKTISFRSRTEIVFDVQTCVFNTRLSISNLRKEVDLYSKNIEERRIALQRNYAKIEWMANKGLYNQSYKVLDKARELMEATKGLVTTPLEIPENINLEPVVLSTENLFDAMNKRTELLKIENFFDLMKHKDVKKLEKNTLEQCMRNLNPRNYLIEAIIKNKEGGTSVEDLLLICDGNIKKMMAENMAMPEDVTVLLMNAKLVISTLLETLKGEENNLNVLLADVDNLMKAAEMAVKKLEIDALEKIVYPIGEMDIPPLFVEGVKQGDIIKEIKIKWTIQLYAPFGQDIAYKDPLRWTSVSVDEIYAELNAKSMAKRKNKDVDLVIVYKDEGESNLEYSNLSIEEAMKIVQDMLRARVVLAHKNVEISLDTFIGELLVDHPLFRTCFEELDKPKLEIPIVFIGEQKIIKIEAGGNKNKHRRKNKRKTTRKTTRKIKRKTKRKIKRKIKRKTTRKTKRKTKRRTERKIKHKLNENTLKNNLIK